MRSSIIVAFTAFGLITSASAQEVDQTHRQQRARRVSILILQKRQHLLKNLRIDLGRSIIVEVNHKTGLPGRDFRILLQRVNHRFQLPRGPPVIPIQKRDYFAPRFRKSCVECGCLAAILLANVLDP